jgi:hypothetical protein
VKAAEHLTAAGLADEADCVRAMAVQVREELVALKSAQIASLQAEIAALGGDCASVCEGLAAPCEQEPAQSVSDWMARRPEPKVGDKTPKQVSLNVKMVELSVSKMKRLGFDFALPTTVAEMGEDRSVTFGLAQGNAILGFVDALERENVAKVLAYPTVVMADGGSFEVNDPHHGTHINVRAKLLNDKLVCVNIRPQLTQRCPNGDRRTTDRTVEIDTGLEMELGKTAVLCSDVEERMVADGGSKSAEPKMVRDDVRTLILVTPELVMPAPAVRPASHQQPSRAESNASEHRENKPRVKSLHIIEARPGQQMPNVRFARPTMER